MSKERELLKRVKAEGYISFGLYKEIEELLAQPEQEQEPVVLQYRTKPNWTGNWSKWEDCSKESYEDYIRVPILHDWTYETRELYTAPPKREPLSAETIAKLWGESYSGTTQMVRNFARAIEKAHGIGENDE